MRYSNNKIKLHLQPLRKLIGIYEKQNHFILHQTFNKWKIFLHKSPKSKLNSSLNTINHNRNVTHSKNAQSTQKGKNKSGSYHFEYEENYNASKINHNIKDHYNSTPSHSVITTSTREFYQRQHDFQTNLSKSKEKIKKAREDECNSLCTFSPKINNSFITKTSGKRQKSAHVRLYEENVGRQYKREKKQYEAICQIKKNSNLNNNKTTVNKQKIEKLYSGYKDKEKKQRQLYEQINHELGYTYTPANNINSKKIMNRSGNLSFEQRNQKLLQDKQNFSFVFDYLRTKKMKGSS